MKSTPLALSDSKKRKMTIVFWSVGLFPFLFISCLLLFQSESDLPPISMLDNPPELQASLIFGQEGDTLGRYWQINRTSANYKDISPYVFDALIATEDERFMKHSGVDFRSLARSLSSLGRSGGASTIPQQLAKLLFTLQQRQRDEIARANGEERTRIFGGVFGKLSRLSEKARENIIATRLESIYTKEEIITMYLNQFDFLYNAVGIENAAKVYFNKTPKDLSKNEAAMLIGMCKNPSLFNPYKYKVTNYRRKIAANLEIEPSAVSLSQILEARATDSTRALLRRNQVLFQWLKNSTKNNEAIINKLSKAEFDSLSLLPLEINYQVVDHKNGAGAYFKESLRKELTTLLLEKKDGVLKIAREDGRPYDIYSDGLKIYTTINSKLQKYAENAVEEHVKKTLQPAFNQNNRGLKNYPFSNDINQAMVNQIMSSARKSTDRYKNLVAAGYSENDIARVFNQKVAMSVFSWKGKCDTIMSPNDSIRYYKAFLHAGLVSIEPGTGFVRAWVGGINFSHFAYDHVRLGKRQVGSTIKPFVYAAALSMGVVNPCSTFGAEEYCLNLVNNNNNIVGKYCPEGTPAATMRDGLALSSNPTTVAVMARMGAFNPLRKTGGPYQIEKLLKSAGISLRKNDVVPSMCLGSMDLSLYELVAAQCIFPNNGVYVKPTIIARIEDRNGKVIYEATEEKNQALSSTVAYEILKMMKGVIERGTGASLRSGKYGTIAPTAGKTGTTQNNSDGWFIGITPDLVTGIWVGAEDRSVRFKSMNFGQGARMALPIYGLYMKQVYKDAHIGLSTLDFAEPPDYDPKKYECADVIVDEVIDEGDVPFDNDF
ncbi:MAG: transglycosylase domain-containing protein [Crocinitomicaceae bacterium]|nr:transglycosylase domain-containing protein [Crocinitomicaceae bacterium]